MTPMHVLLRILSLFLAAVLLQGAACPTPIDAPPDKLSAPEFADAKVVVRKTAGYYEELVYLAWSPPANDTHAVGEYVILQTLPFDTAIDTLGIFPDEPQRLASTRTAVYQPTEDIRRYASGEEMELYYRILAIDTLGTSGDTSVPCTLALLKTADLSYPRDSLKENKLEWQVQGLSGEYETNFIIFGENDSTPLYIGDTTFWIGGGIYETKTYRRTLPNSVYPLAQGNYTWAARLQRTTPPYAISYKIGRFHAP